MHKYLFLDQICDCYGLLDQQFHFLNENSKEVLIMKCNVSQRAIKF